MSVLLNGEAGTARGLSDTPRRIATALEDAGAELDLHAVTGRELTTCARALRAHSEVVVAAGGDGTISAIAEALAGSDTALAVLPLGTRNHFARDAGIPLDLTEAARVAVHGVTRRIDVGTVNGRTFVNNCSLGLYPRIVARRQALWRAGRPKGLAMAAAALTLLRRLPMVQVRLTSDGEPMHLQTPVVFVGNNHYQMSLFAPGARERLDSGELSVYVPLARSGLGFAALVLRALLGRTRDGDHFVTHAALEVTIETWRPRAIVAIDGEVATLDAPLRLAVRRRGLAVRVPRADLRPSR